MKKYGDIELLESVHVLRGFRLPKQESPFYANQLNKFAEHILGRYEADFVSFGKQDTRGYTGITVFKDACPVNTGCHMRWSTVKEVLTFVEGYNFGLGNRY